MPLLKPKRLRPGDRIAAVTLSWGGPGTYPERYRVGKAQLEEGFGVEVVEMPHTLADADWLARHPEARAADLMAAFADPEIRGIVSTIGGDDSLRLFPHLDLGVIRANPKVFLGYSDTTASHFACLQAGLVSFFGPAIMSGFAENAGMFPYMVESVRRTLFRAEPIGVIEPNRDGWTVELLPWGEPDNQRRRRKLEPPMDWRWLQGKGVSEGPLIGGTLELIDFLRGTPLWPGSEHWDGAVFFLETSEEGAPPGAVGRCLRSLASMGTLARLRGVLFARPGGGVPVKEFDAYDEAILSVVAGEEGLAELPVVTRLDFGHTDPMFVLPYGVRARLDCDRQELSIPESAVSD